MNMMIEVIPKSDYWLYVKTEDGRAGLFNVKPYLDSEAFAPLWEISEFEQVYNGRYFVEWACGADLSFDTIEARWRTGEDLEEVLVSLGMEIEAAV
jgi:hypothetical protein